MRKWLLKINKKKDPAITDAPSPAQTAPKDLFRSRGDDHVQNGDYNAAVVMFTEALRYAPADTTLLISRSLAHMMSTPERLDLALQDTDAAIQHDPTNGQAWSQKGEALLREGDIQGAEEALVNAVGFTKGLDKLTAQRSLADVRARRGQTPAAQPSHTSVQSTPPTPLSEPSLLTTPLPHTPSVTQTSPTKNPTTAISGSAPPALSPSNTESSARGRTSSAAEHSPTPVQSTPPTASPKPPQPTTPLSSIQQTSSTTNPARTISGSAPPAPSPTNTESSARGRTSSVVEHSPTSVQSTLPTVSPKPPQPTTPLSSIQQTSSTTNPARTISDSAPPAPSSAQPSAHGRTSSAAEPSRTSVQSKAPAPSSEPSLPTTPLSHTPTVTQTSSTTSPTAGSTLRTPSNTQPSGGTSRNIANQPARSAPVTRIDDSSSVSEVPVSSLPLRPEDLINLTSEAPPDYTPNLHNPDPTVRALSQQALTTRLTQLETALAAKNKGSLSIRPYATAEYIDAVKLIYVGMTQFELTARELVTPTYLHPSFRTMAIDMLGYPGNTFLDMDCESSMHYEGKVPGTASISGYSEEYREYQLLKSPLLNLSLEGTDTLPTMALDKIVDRIRLRQRQPTAEDNVVLRECLGLSQLTTLQSGWYSAGGRQRQIEAICMALTRSLYEAPTRFIDFSKARNISNNTLGSPTQGIGLQNFLFQILLGAELLVRLRAEPVTTSYTTLITDSISSLIVLSALWMHNVTIQGPSATATTSTTITPTIPPNPRYILVATQHQLQAEGLIRFGEALSWPYMDEARNYIENAYQDLTAGRAVVGFDICDWLFGLILPGKIFRHRIMCCLVYASPSVRSFNPAPFWENGLVVKNKSYWPKRSVLGRVLGGLTNPKSVCGWIGPVPAPEGSFSGWIRLSARRVDIPVPVSTTQTSLQSLGFGQPNGTESPEAILQTITDPNEWIQACPPYRLTNDSSRSVFKGIHLIEIPGTTATSAGANSTIVTSKEYRASLEFEVNGTLTRYTLYSNPLFVYAPPCVGTHTMHRRQAQNYLSSVVRVADLKEAYPSSDSLVIVNALGQGEEVVARAWCAERATHAVIRRDGECCFACAVGVTAGRTGLGFNVLIWSG